MPPMRSSVRSDTVPYPRSTTAGVPFGYVARSNFRESESMVEFIQRQMPGIAVSESEFNNGNWTAKLADLLDLAPVKRNIANGAEQIGRFIEDILR